jgi:hypothetical protein
VSIYEKWRLAALEYNRGKPSPTVEESPLVTTELEPEGLPLPAAERLVFTLPADPIRLEELNMPEELASIFAGQRVTLEVMPEAMPRTYAVDKDIIPADVPVLIDRAGKMWNDHWPLRASIQDGEGRAWNIPRYWLTTGPDFYDCGSRLAVTVPVDWTEGLHMPSWWDLREVNIASEAADNAHGKVATVRVTARPDELVRVHWTDSQDRTWRIPANWRRKRIRLPGSEDVATEYSGKVVSVNWHPGSLCCLPDGYRFRDSFGERWEVRMADCTLMGYGDAEEGHG